MSDTITQAIHITTTDDASPALRKIVENLKNLEKQCKRTFVGTSGSFDTGMSGLTKLGANHRVAPSTKAAAIGMAELRKRFTFERRMAAQASREAASAERAAAAASSAALGSLRERMGLQARMSRQERQEAASTARQARQDEAARIRGIRQAVAFGSRMARQRQAEERAASRDQDRTVAGQERDRAAALRRQIAGHRYQFGLRSRYDRDLERDRTSNRDDFIHYGRNAGRSTRDAASRFVRGSAAVGAAGAAGTALAGRRILGAEADVDAAEIGARQYAGLSKDAARNLRDKWAAPLAEKLGISTAKLLTSYTDAIKLGVPVEGAKAFAGLATQTSEAWAVPFENVTDILGTVNTLLTSTGEAFSIDKLKSVANTLQHLAAKQSTTPEKLISFFQRGAGAAQVLGMSQEAGLAFGSASTSLGNQAGASGRLFDYVASRLIELPRLTKKHGDEGRRARDLVRSLGYGSAEAMNSQRRENPDAFLPEFMERFSKIQNPKKQEEAIRFFSGREWMGEFGRMVKGIDTYKEASKLSREAKGLDAIGAVWDLHRTKLAFVFKQFRAGWLNIMGEFGKVLSPLARQAGDYFLGWSEKLRQGGIADRFKASIEGFVQGLGFANLPALLEGAFGKPGEGDAGSIRAWGDAARGFGAGLRDVGNTIAAFFRVFTGSDATPETIGRWTARILGFSAALLVVAPVIGVLGSLGSALVALSLAGAAAWRIIKVAGIAGGVTGTAGAAAGAGAAASGGILSRLLGGLGKLFLPATVAATSGLGKGEQDSITKRLGAWAKDRETSKATAPTSWVNPPAAKAIVDSLDGHAKVLKQSFEGGSGYQGLIRKASLNDDGAREVSASVDRLGARIQLAALGAAGSAASAASGGLGGSGGLAGAAGGGYVGSMLGGTPGARRGYFGGGGIGGAGSDMVGYGANPGAYKASLDYIARAEGTAGQAGGGYNTSLGYGRFLPGGKEQKLTEMSLNDVLNLGDHMRRQPGNPNSSALGRYQIVGQTLRDQMVKLGLKGDEKFDEAMQDRIGANLIRQRGANAGGLGQEWASLKGGKGAEAAALVGQIPKGSSIVPGIRPAEGITGAQTGAAGAVDIAKQFEGADEFRDNARLKRFVGREVIGAQNAWCAGFVNSSLKAVGLNGSGSAVANSFLNWGKGIDPSQSIKGDVLVEHRNRGLNATGGHVGMATGNKRVNERGELELEMISGNNGNAVRTEYERASKLAVRRSTEVTPESLAKGVSDTVVARMGDGAMGRGNGGGVQSNSAAITAPINIYHHGDSEQLGHKVQRHLQESRNMRTTDQSFSGA